MLLFGKNPHRRRGLPMAALLAFLSLLSWSFSAEAERTLRRETETALATLRPQIESAAARFRSEFSGKFLNRSGQPIPETELLAEVRRATQATDVLSRIEALWRELEQQRLDPRGFGDQLDTIFEQAIVTTWDVHLADARRTLAVAQQNLDTEAARLRQQWTRTVAEITRDSASAAQREQRIAAASGPIQSAERALHAQAERVLTAAARQLAGARQTLRDLVASRAEAAQAAGRPGAPQRLTALIAAQFESVGANLADGGSSLDSFLATARLALPAVVLRNQPGRLELAERLQPLLVGRLAAENENRLQGPRPAPPPRVAFVFTLERGSDPQTGLPIRTLGVLGHELLARGLPTVSGEADRRYEVLATRAGVLGVRAEESHAPLWQALATRAASGLLPSEATMAQLLDAVLVRVRLPAGLVPGLETFQLAGAEAVWPLDAPTTRATLAFVRRLPWATADEVDRPLELFLNSEFAVQVETEHPIRVDQLEIALIGPEGRLALEDARGTRVDTLPASPLPGFPRIVRTPPVFLLPAGANVPPAQRTPGSYHVWLKHQDTVLATVVGRPFDDGGAATTVDAAVVLASPGNIATVDGKGMLFLEALADAARIHNVDLPRRTDLGAEPAVDTITHTFLAQFRQHEIRFTLSDHAAMLALKRAFLAMAGRVLASHREVLGSPQKIAAYVPEMMRIMRRGARLASDSGNTRNFPLGYLRYIRFVSDRGLSAFARREYYVGANVPLIYAFEDGPPSAIYDDPEQARIFRYSATRVALETQIAELEKAIAFARACDDDDITELLELVGANFEPVIAEVMPRLVRSETDPRTGRLRWVPDRGARQAVVRLANTLEEHLTAARGAKADTEAALALLTATGLGLGGGVASKVVLAVASAASVGVAALDVANLELSRAESRFAAAAVEVIGEDRLVLRTQRADLSPTPYLTLALSVVGLKFDAADMARAIQLSAARRATERSLAEIAEHGFTRFGRLPPKQQALASALMDEATALRAAGKPLMPAQQVALRAADTIESQFAARHPWGGAAFELKPSLHPLPDDFRSAVTEPHVDFRSAITEAEPRTSPGVSSAPDSLTPVTVGGPAPPPLPAPRRYIDVAEIPMGMPLPGYELRDPSSGRLFRVGQPYGAGAYATTYDLLDETGRPTGRVVKFLRQPFNDESKIMARFRNAEAAGRGTTPVPWDATPLPELIDRLEQGQRLLERAKIPHLKMATMEEPFAAAGRNGAPPFIFQDVIPENAVRKTANLEPGQKEAIAVLYKRLADANLIWLDGHLGNIYFTRVGSGWEAGILDPDMLVRFDAPIASEFLRDRIGQIFALPARAGINSLEARPELLKEVFTPDIAQRVCRSAHEFMARMFEHKRLVRYETVENAGGGAAYAFRGALDPEIVARIFGPLEQYLPR